MLAKLRAGTQYDLIFPSTECRPAEQRASCSRSTRSAQQRRPVSAVFNDPWYDKKSDLSVPYTVYTTGLGCAPTSPE